MSWNLRSPIDQIEIAAVEVRMAKESLSLSQAKLSTRGSWLLGNSKIALPCLSRILMIRFSPAIAIRLESGDHVEAT